MTVRSLRDTDLEYRLISYTKHGVERTDDPDAPTGRLSDEVFATLDAAARSERPVSDIFLFSHGWLNDFKSAIGSYNGWIGAMLQHTDDLSAIQQHRPGFHPLLIGLHWPSSPFGNEDLSADVSYGLPVGGASGGSGPSEKTEPSGMLDEAADGIADTPRARRALATILESARDDIEPDVMPSEVADAYQVLWQESELGLDGPSGAPGRDAQAFDPEGLYEEAVDGDLSYGGGVVGGLLAPLRPLSFWTMKHRARRFGERGGAQLLRKLQRRTDAKVRIHLMGHSFGCIVVSSMVAGADGNEDLVRPVDTVFLAQGAVSCWSYTPRIPVAKGAAGYFSKIPQQGKVAGALVTTQSKFDQAVGRAYPLATSSRSVSFAPVMPGAGPQRKPPKDGSLGAFGIQGPDLDLVSRPMLAADGDYGFEAGRIYNLESSQYICDGRVPMLGAHSDIAKPEVAHAFWCAIRASGTSGS